MGQGGGAEGGVVTARRRRCGAKSVAVCSAMRLWLGKSALPVHLLSWCRGAVSRRPFVSLCRSAVQLGHCRLQLVPQPKELRTTEGLLFCSLVELGALAL